MHNNENNSGDEQYNTHRGSIDEFAEVGIEKVIELFDQLTDENEDICAICCTLTFDQNNTLFFTFTYESETDWTYKFTNIKICNNGSKKFIPISFSLNLITCNFLNFLNHCIENDIPFYKKHFIIIHCKYDTYCIFFDPLYVLGYGTFGYVYKAYSKTQTYAVKIVVSQSARDQQSVVREMCVLNTMKYMNGIITQHDVLITGNNVTCYKPFSFDKLKCLLPYVSNFSADDEDEPEYVFDTQEQPSCFACFMVLDYLRGCTLASYARTHEMATAPNRYNIYQQTKQNRLFVLDKMLDIFDTLKNVIHMNNIIHGDIKPDNLMIHGSKQCFETVERCPNGSFCGNKIDLVYEKLTLIDYGLSCKTLHTIEYAHKYFALKGTLQYIYPLIAYYHHVQDNRIKEAILKLHNNSVLQFAKYTDLWALLMTVCEIHCLNPQRFLMMHYLETVSVKLAASATQQQLYIYALTKIGYLIMKYLCDDKPNYFDFIDNTYESNNQSSWSEIYSDIEYQMYVYAKEFFVKLKKGTLNDIYSLVYMAITDTKLH